MLIFNTTYLVSDSIYEEWLSWIREEHIPAMIETGYFQRPQIAKVLSNEQQDGASYSTQFQISDMAALQAWNESYGEAYQSHCELKFGTEVIFFSTVLELIP